MGHSEFVNGLLPASFIEISLTRLQDLGRVTAEWAEGVRTEFQAAQAKPGTWMTTPLEF